MEKELQRMREKLLEKSEDWQEKEFQRRYEIESEKLEMDNADFDDDELREKIRSEVRQEAEKDVEEQVDEERERMLKEDDA